MSLKSDDRVWFLRFIRYASAFTGCALIYVDVFSLIRELVYGYVVEVPETIAVLALAVGFLYFGRAELGLQGLRLLRLFAFLSAVPLVGLLSSLLFPHSMTPRYVTVLLFLAGVGSWSWWSRQPRSTRKERGRSS